MFLEAFFKLLSFFLNLVLEDPISIVHVDRMFRYKTYPKIRKSYKSAIFTFFSFLTLLDMMNNDPLIMLKSFWNPPYPFYASNPVKIWTTKVDHSKSKVFGSVSDLAPLLNFFRLVYSKNPLYTYLTWYLRQKRIWNPTPCPLGIIF